jgi:RNA:NAD 2'-phosphotransferase (TPT1/KptA family)
MSHRGKPKGRDVTVSKALSYLLRHAAEREGLKMNAQGYANVSDVVCACLCLTPEKNKKVDD